MKSIGKINIPQEAFIEVLKDIMIFVMSSEVGDILTFFFKK